MFLQIGVFQQGLQIETFDHLAVGRTRVLVAQGAAARLLLHGFTRLAAQFLAPVGHRTDTLVQLVAAQRGTGHGQHGGKDQRKGDEAEQVGGGGNPLGKVVDHLCSA